ncbi:MAG: glycine cleavage system aminomethyltransferase GcvT [Planctomycetes bacterium]|jgi:aminomethyltransferase|nr:glycine cleavage system aminomethyltransferase GcvT [Planctomycetota bacterium]
MNTTPLNEWHRQHGGRLVDFAGWELPVQYEGILAEHTHCREACAIFDTSHMGQFLITGPNAAEQLAAAITQDASGLGVGRGTYGFILNDGGGIIDDTILFCLGEAEFLLIVNAGTTAGDLAVLEDRLNNGTNLRYLGDWSKLDVQGPEACEVLSPLVDGDLTALKYFGVTRMKVQDTEAVVARTGYTGELGFEVFLPGKALPDLADAVVADERVKPAGLGARDSLRLEIGYPLYGHELSTEVTPVEAGMEVFLDLQRDFVGVETLRKQAEDPTPRTLVGLLTEQRRRFAEGDTILAADGEEVGQVTSGTFAPSLGVAAGMGYVDREATATGTPVIIRTARAELPATVAERPLYKDGTARSKLT